MPDGGFDPRWHAIIAVGEFVQTAPEVLWPFTLRWGLLEHLLEHHFDTFIERIESAAMTSPEFARTVLACWTFRKSDETHRAARFGRLLASLRNTEPPT